MTTNCCRLILFLAVTTALAGQQAPPWTKREQMLLARIEQLESRLAAVEARLPNAAPAPPALPAAVPWAPDPSSPVAPAAATPQAASKTPDPFQGTTINLTLDGYYGYNFNHPAGQINLLRAYDVLSNSFSLNQAALIVERAPNVSEGRRFGARVDLQYGQATETLQGNPANEPRPQVYRPVFQAYGSYVAPIGEGLTIDFGKWASALGVENNYTKDQINYSRSYFFNFLPFYHFGFRAGYDLTSRLNVAYWLVNGAQQSEDFNGFKSQALILTTKPAKSLTWNLNYYTGVENAPQGQPAPLPPGLPLQPGLDLRIGRVTPGGRRHIIDTYAAWTASERLTLAAEADYVIDRLETSSAPSRVAGGAAYVRYRFTPRFALAGRSEYLSDRGGLFSGVTQALKETTVTADYSVAEGFLVRGEWRRDFSNQPFFLSGQLGAPKRQQSTATLGLIWWFGGKQGAW
ncbi:MAG TPA: outer membrane beta-barrel protein [Bryobacterales bacterium]|nr:outer membrane beta-barrel protein [Bryobacterales bacterium]